MSQTTEVDVQEALERMICDTIRVPCSKVLLSPEMHAACLDRIVKRYGFLYDGRLGTTLTDKVFVRGVPAEKCAALSGADYALVPKSPETVTIGEVPVKFVPPWDKKKDILYQAVRSTWLDLNTWLTMGNSTATKKDIEELHDRMVKAMQQATESDSPRVWSEDQPVVPDEQRPFHHFDDQKLLDALKLSYPGGVESILRSDNNRDRTTLLTAEYVAGAMLDPAVRKRVLEARVFEPE